MHLALVDYTLYFQTIPYTLFAMKKQETGGSGETKEIEAAKDAVERSKGYEGVAKTRVL